MFKKSMKKNNNQDELLIQPPEKGKKISLNKIINSAPKGILIKLAEGEYLIDKTIIISNPIRLSGEGIDKTTVTGYDLRNLLIFKGKGKLSLAGIAFSLESQKKSNVVVVKSGELEMDQCTVEGGKDPQISKRDFGAGLNLLGTSIAEISNTIFRKNILGISVQDQSSLTLLSNEFSENVYGIVFRDNGQCNSRDNKFSDNQEYGFIAYDNAEVSSQKDVSFNNKGGFGFLFSSKARIEFSEAYENKYHGFFINDWADVRINKCKSYSNGYSGFAIYADSHSQLQECESYENGHHGFEIFENASSVFLNNKIWDNHYCGVMVGDTAKVKIETNEIFENAIGIQVDDEAIAMIENNKIYRHYDGAFRKDLFNKSTIGENELYENGEDYVNDENSEYKNDDENLGFELGNIFAKMFGGENISSDPNTIAIPLGHLFSGNYDVGDEEIDEDEED